jgi:phage gp36-like protein
MTQFATADEFVAKFGDSEATTLTQLENPTATEPDEDLLNRALQDASAVMEGYLPAVSAPYPQVLIACACDVARYLLDRNLAREDVRKRYEDWQSWLKQVAQGLVKIPGIEPSQDLPARGSPAIAEGSPVFSSEGLNVFLSDRY